MLAGTRASDADKAAREDRILRPNRNEKRFEKHRNKGKKRRSASLFPFRWVREGISLREKISHKENRQINFCPFCYGKIEIFLMSLREATKLRRVGQGEAAFRYAGFPRCALNDKVGDCYHRNEV